MNSPTPEDQPVEPNFASKQSFPPEYQDGLYSDQVTKNPVGSVRTDDGVSNRDDTYPDNTHPNDRHRLGVNGIICWCLILGFTAFSLYSTMQGRPKDSEKSDFFQNPSAIEMAQTVLQGKGIVAQENVQRFLLSIENEQEEVADTADEEMPEADQSEQSFSESDGTIDSSDTFPSEDSQESNTETSRQPSVEPSLNRGTLIQRLSYVVLVNEIDGPEVARESFIDLQERIELNPRKLSPQQQEINDLIGQLLDEYSRGDFQSSRTDQATRNRLIDEMGWFGELLLVPEGANDEESRRSVLQSAAFIFWGLFGVVSLALIGMFIGFVFLIVILALTVGGHIQFRFAGSDIPANIYLQTFTLWLVLFVGFQFLMAVILKLSNIQSEIAGIYLSSIGFFGSLIALNWPLMRGVSMSQLLKDMGLRWKNAWLETIVAGFSYLSVLFPLMLSLLFTGVLIGTETQEEFTTSEGPSHPVHDYLAEGSLSVFFAVLLLACVAAPIVEELMFRGVLYRHLRNFSQAWSRWASVLLACMVNSFVFAAIHPQGLAGIPMLMTLAIGFSIVREYRDSLTAAIVMHAISNFLVLTLSFFILQ